MSDYSLFLAVVLPAVCWLLINLTTRRMAVWYRALSVIYGGLLGGTLAIIQVAARVFDQSPTDLRQEPRVFLMALCMAALIMIATALLLSRKSVQGKVSFPIRMVASLASAGVQFICISIVIMLAGTVSGFLRNAGDEVARREIPGTGVSRKVVYVFFSFIVPLGMAIAAIISLLKAGRFRDRQIEKLVMQNPPRLHIAWILAFFLLLATFATIAQETGLVR